MAINYVKKPFFLSTLILIILIYCGVIKTPPHNYFYSIFPEQEIASIKGTIINSPVKSGSGKNYSADFKIDSVSSKNNFYSQSIGIVKIIIPSKLIESLFPGKLLSLSKSVCIYEAGCNYELEGYFSNSMFLVTNCCEYSWPATLFGKLDYIRAVSRLHFKRLMFGFNKAGGLLLALFSGAKEYIDSQLSENFRKAGLSHILALSGMHLSLFSSIAMLIGTKIGRKKLSFIIRIVSLIIFVWFAGFSPSLLRAFICNMLLLFAVIANVEEPDMLLILCFSFMLQISISPSDLSNTGFILSYGALSGILLFNNFFSKIYSKIFPKYIAASFSASTSAQIFTIPISLKLFGCFSPIGIIATVFVSPLITLFIYSGLILIVLTLIIPLLLKYSVFFIQIEYNVIKFAVDIFSKAPQWSIN